MFNSVTDSVDQLDSRKLFHIWHVQQCHRLSHRFPDQPESRKSFKQRVTLSWILGTALWPVPRKLILYSNATNAWHR